MEIKKIEPAFEDERGSIWDLLTNDTIHHIGLLISKKGSIRGKHFHKEQKQYTLVLNGRVRISTKNLLEKNSELKSFELKKMNMVLFPPFHYHSIEALEDSTCLILTSKSRQGSDYEKDTIRIDDIHNLNWDELDLK